MVDYETMKQKTNKQENNPNPFLRPPALSEGKSALGSRMLNCCVGFMVWYKCNIYVRNLSQHSSDLHGNVMLFRLIFSEVWIPGNEVGKKHVALQLLVS